MFFKQLKEELFSSPLYLFSVLFLLLLVALSLLAPVLPLDPNTTNVSQMNQPPGLDHLFGTDNVGRDYFARVLYGGRISLLVGILAMLASVLIGSLVGIVASYFGGLMDGILMRTVDVLSSIPWQVLVIVLSVFLKPGLTTIIIVIGGFSWMRISRLIRAETLSAKTHDYVSHPAHSHRGSQQQYFVRYHDGISPFFPRHWYPATAGFLGKSLAKCPIYLAECAPYGDFARSLYPIDHLFLQ